MKLYSLLTAAKKMLAAYYEGAVIYENHVPENFTRPSFLVTLEPDTAEKSTALITSRSVPLTVVFFPTVDDYHMSTADVLLGAVEELESLFLNACLTADGERITFDAVRGETEIDFCSVTALAEWYDGFGVNEDGTPGYAGTTASTIMEVLHNTSA